MGSKSRILTMLPSLWLSFSFFIIHFSFLNASSSTNTTTVYDGESGGRNNASIVASSSSPSSDGMTITQPLAPPPQTLFKSKGSQLRPGIAVILGVLATVFSITLLLLLYAKHYERSALNPFSNRGHSPSADRKNSGIDRSVIDSLPIFRFASLMGQKDGLECAVCLNIFESTEVLRLLPKCKHAFHVDCVDAWLDAHSTCPLCRYRVDGEDILLVEDNRILYPRGDTPSAPRSSATHHTPESGSAVSRVSGRHSFAGNNLQVIVETPKAVVPRRSLDSWSSRRKRNSEKVGAGSFDRPRKDELLLEDKAAKGKDVAQEQRRLEHRIIISGRMNMEVNGPHDRWSDVQTSDLPFLQVVPRRSQDSWSSRRKRNSEKVGAGSFDRPRKDELLLEDKAAKGKDVAQEQRRLEHRIIIPGLMDMEANGPHHRWSDVQPSDLLFLQAEMILSDRHRFSGPTRFRQLISTRMAGEGSSSSNNSNSFSISHSRNVGGGSHGGISNSNLDKIWGALAGMQ